MKNPDKIVEAFRLIGPDFLKSQNIRLILAGNGEMENELMGRVEKYELGDYIRFEGSGKPGNDSGLLQNSRFLYHFFRL